MGGVFLVKLPYKYEAKIMDKVNSLFHETHSIINFRYDKVIDSTLSRLDNSCKDYIINTINIIVNPNEYDDVELVKEAFNGFILEGEDILHFIKLTKKINKYGSVEYHLHYEI